MTAGTEIVLWQGKVPRYDVLPAAMQFANDQFMVAKAQLMHIPRQLRQLDIEGPPMPWVYRSTIPFYNLLWRPWLLQPDSRTSVRGHCLCDNCQRELDDERTALRRFRRGCIIHRLNKHLTRRRVRKWRDLTEEATLTVGGNTSITGTTSLTGATTITSNLTVNGSTGINVTAGRMTE